MITNIMTRSCNHDYKWFCDEKPAWFLKFYDECNSNVAPVMALVRSNKELLFLITISSAIRKDIKGRALRWQIAFKFEDNPPELKKLPDLISKWLDDYSEQKRHKPNKITDIIDSFDEKMIDSALGHEGEREWFNDKKKSIFDKLFAADFETKTVHSEIGGYHFWGAIKNVDSKKDFVAYICDLCSGKKNGVALVCSVGMEENLAEKATEYETSFFLMNNCDKIDELLSSGTVELKKTQLKSIVTKLAILTHPITIKIAILTVLMAIVAFGIIGLIKSCQKVEKSVLKQPIVKPSRKLRTETIRKNWTGLKKQQKPIKNINTNKIDKLTK